MFHEFHEEVMILFQIRFQSHIVKCWVGLWGWGGGEEVLLLIQQEKIKYLNCTDFEIFITIRLLHSILYIVNSTYCMYRVFRTLATNFCIFRLDQDKHNTL